MSRNDEIANYYDNCESDYRLLWDLNRSHALHAGYWDQTTLTLHDALVRENEILAEIAKIKPTDHVLDAGCGIGGSSIYLAEKYQCQVTGITISTKQVETATTLAKQRHSSPCPQFFVMDFTKTTFPDKSFDVIWGIESICHAQDKEAFIKEASRLLKPGGRLVIADGFATTKAYSAKEALWMQYWLNGWGVDDLETSTAFEVHLKKWGFHTITRQNITANILPSSKRLFLYSFPAIALSKLGEWVRLRNKIQTNNLWSALYQHLSLKRNLWSYEIFYAERDSSQNSESRIQ